MLYFIIIGCGYFRTPFFHRNLRGEKNAFKNLEKIAPIVFIGPAVVILILIVIFPMIYSIGISLAEWNLMRGGNWIFVGLRNYYYTFFKDPDFYTSLRVTLVYVAAVVSLELFIGLGIALLLNRPIKNWNSADHHGYSYHHDTCCGWNHMAAAL